ncbi:MAG: hypothetical protein GY765_27435, partial [bacterium]|nr:hypothetical protein [bacterium]
MKNFRTNQKLQLKKETVATLDAVKLDVVKGGTSGETDGTQCTCGTTAGDRTCKHDKTETCVFHSIIC